MADTTAVSKIGCIVRTDAGIPDPILDLSSLTITMDNQGVATLSISIFSKQTNISGDAHTFAGVAFNEFTVSLTPTRVFKGYIEGVSPQPSEGFEYVDYRVTAKGIIC